MSHHDMGRQHEREDSAETRSRDEEVIRREVGEGHVITYTDEGWDSRVYVIDGGKAVVKFPRTPEIQEQYRRETGALHLLETMRTPVRTPHLKWESPDLAYIGYEGIVGESLAQRMPQLGAREKEFVGAAIGGFLEKLHSAQLPEAPPRDIEAKIANYFEKYRLAEPALARAFSPDELRSLERFFFVELPTEMRRLGSETKLCHGDLGPWNIIVKSTGDVGVIDFGDVGYEDPSIDFSGLGDDTILQSAFDAYHADDWLREKVALRIKAFPILDIPFYLGKHDRAGVQACVELVRHMFIEGSDSSSARFLRN